MKKLSFFFALSFILALSTPRQGLSAQKTPASLGPPKIILAGLALGASIGLGSLLWGKFFAQELEEEEFLPDYQAIDRPELPIFLSHQKNLEELFPFAPAKIFAKTRFDSLPDLEVMKTLHRKAKIEESFFYDVSTGKFETHSSFRDRSFLKKNKIAQKSFLAIAKKALKFFDKRKIAIKEIRLEHIIVYRSSFEISWHQDTWESETWDYISVRVTSQKDASATMGVNFIPTLYLKKEKDGRSSVNEDAFRRRPMLNQGLDFKSKVGVGYAAYQGDIKKKNPLPHTKNFSTGRIFHNVSDQELETKESFDDEISPHRQILVLMVKFQ